VRGIFNGVDEGVRIPIVVREKAAVKVSFIASFKQFASLHGQPEIAGVNFYAAEPILCISVVGLAPVHDGMDETAILIFNLLGDGVRFIQMIMPEKQNGAQKSLNGSGNSRLSEGAGKHLVNSAGVDGIRPRCGTERGEGAGIEHGQQIS
jgi:hypothetical protein